MNGYVLFFVGFLLGLAVENATGLFKTLSERVGRTDKRGGE
jgi:hypothetical protein